MYLSADDVAVSTKETTHASLNGLYATVVCPSGISSCISHWVWHNNNSADNTINLSISQVLWRGGKYIYLGVLTH